MLSDDLLYQISERAAFAWLDDHPKITDENEKDFRLASIRAVAAAIRDEEVNPLKTALLMLRAQANNHMLLVEQRWTLAEGDEGR